MGQKFQCPECDHQATQKIDLVRHQKSVHMGQKFHCTECDHQATQKSHLASHQKSLHMGQKFQCTECDYESLHKSAITFITFAVSFISICKIFEVNCQKILVLISG